MRVEYGSISDFIHVGGIWDEYISMDHKKIRRDVWPMNVAWDKIQWRDDMNMAMDIWVSKDLGFFYYICKN
jgi:hypothetical protein